MSDPVPITLFSPHRDPAAVVSVIRSLAPDAKIDGEDNTWRQILVPGRKKLLGLKQDPPLILRNDPNYYAEPNWSRQLQGFTALMLRWRRNENTKALMSLITALKFSMVSDLRSMLDLNDAVAPNTRMLLAVAQKLDAILFVPWALYDARGRVIVSPTGEFDPEAVVPDIPAVSIDSRSGHPQVRLPADAHFRLLGPNTEPDKDAPPPPPPPTADRIARRALVLAAVAGRAMLESENPADPGVDDTRKRLIQWIEDLGLRDELEPVEAAVLDAPLGGAPQKDAVNASWRSEGLAVLAWALNRWPLAHNHYPIDPGKLFPSVGILNLDRARALLMEPPLRPRKELLEMQTTLLAIHWRIRNQRWQPGPLNFAEFCDGRTPWLGKVDLTGVRLVENDLALSEVPIARAPQQAFQLATSIAMERHHAINWICGGPETYSDVDTST